MANRTGDKSQQRKRPVRRERKSRLGLFTAVILLLLVAAFLGVLELNRPHVHGDRLNLSTFLDRVEHGKVHSAVILDEDSFIVGRYDNGGGVAVEYNAPLIARLQNSPFILETLFANKVDVTVDQQVGKRVAGLAATLLPAVMLVVLLAYVLISRRRGTGLFSVRSGARRIKPDDTTVRFADVAGQDAAVSELRELKAFLSDPARFVGLGASIPKGVLLFGPPGCGKTMLARALAGESQANFYSISGSDFVEIYVGVGASRVRDLFREARENAPALIFIDELDSVGRARGRSGVTESHPEQEQALNQILAEMDGFSTSDGIIVVGATNRPDILDQALLRPGRFDRAIGLERPDEDARLAILNVHARGKALTPGVDLGVVATKTQGLSGADLASIMNEAALMAGRAERSAIVQGDVLQALARVQDAPERQRRLALRSQSIGRRRLIGDERVNFADVAGQDDAIAELKEIREFLSDPERFTVLGAAIPKGVLLYGPPGCGKTMLAKALACEADAAFLSVAASEFVELYVGMGAARVRDLFAEARSMPPAIIFIDELDAVGGSRTDRLSAYRGDEEQSLNQLLAEMDGFRSSSGTIVLGATNRPDVLDPALLRPGRFDRTIGLGIPDEAGRRAILAVHARGKSLALDADLGAIAHGAHGLTGADLAGVVNESALLAGRAEKRVIEQSDLAEALRRILAAPDRQRRLSMRPRSVGHRFTGEERTTFAQVAGIDDAVEELLEVRDFLTEPARFAEMGARTPRGIMLSGPPGCGKTLLAKALAGETNAAFFSVAATEFVEVWVGQGAARVRDLFADARSMAPSIVFLDEIDAVGSQRMSARWGAEREQDSTLNQLLIELDGFDTRQAVIVMAATNRPDLLDRALTRPGRFDRHVTISLPDRAGRKAILELYCKGKPIGRDVDLDAIAGLTTGMSGADLENVLNEAALLAARRGSRSITMPMVEKGIDRAVGGMGSRKTLLSPEERRVVAYHEVGHALVAAHLKSATPPHKLTIVPRGGYLGYCAHLDDERVLLSGAMLIDRMASILGGWAAERLVFGDVSSGASNDLQEVGNIARRMVRDYGMSDKMGPLSYPNRSGRGGSQPDFSEDSARSIDDEVRRLVQEAAKRAHAVLSARRDRLDRIADVLIAKETISGEELGVLTGTVRAVRPEASHAPARGHLERPGTR